jgi:hypothetical protein
VWCVHASAEWDFGGWKDKSWTKAFVFWTRSNISLSACHTLMLYLLSGHMCEVCCETLPTVEVFMCFVFHFLSRIRSKSVLASFKCWQDLPVSLLLCGQ